MNLDLVVELEEKFLVLELWMFGQPCGNKSIDATGLSFRDSHSRLIYCLGTKYLTKVSWKPSDSCGDVSTEQLSDVVRKTKQTKQQQNGSELYVGRLNCD